MRDTALTKTLVAGKLRNAFRLCLRQSFKVPIFAYVTESTGTPSLGLRFYASPNARVDHA